MTSLSKCVIHFVLVVFAVVALVLSYNGITVKTENWWIASTVVALGIAFNEFYVPKWASSKAARLEACQIALKRIDKEEGNFETLRNAISTGKVFVGLHKKTIEVYRRVATTESYVEQKPHP